MEVTFALLGHIGVVRSLQATVVATLYTGESSVCDLIHINAGCVCVWSMRALHETYYHVSSAQLRCNRMHALTNLPQLHTQYTTVTSLCKGSSACTHNCTPTSSNSCREPPSQCRSPGSHWLHAYIPYYIPHCSFSAG